MVTTGLRAYPREAELGAERSAMAHGSAQKQEVMLAVHKFKVGQTVDFLPGRGALSSSSRQYKIVKLLPAEGGQLQYRIKGSSEPFERVAREMDLSLP